MYEQYAFWKSSREPGIMDGPGREEPKKAKEVMGLSSNQPELWAQEIQKPLEMSWQVRNFDFRVDEAGLLTGLSVMRAPFLTRCRAGT